MLNTPDNPQPRDQRLQAKHARLAALRPLAGPDLEALARWYDIELTYTSNAIEGSTLTRNETAIVLEHGITVAGKPLKDHLEATGHRDALIYMRELAALPSPVREADIRHLHRLILQKIDPEEAGRYSTRLRTIVGSSLVLPSPAEIAPLMQELAHWLETAPLTPQTAFDAHERLVTIHPFSDGNGRTSRLLMNLLLLQAGYPPVVILPEDKPAYFDALDATRHGNREPFYHFLYLRLEQALDHTLKLLEAN